MQTYYSSAAVVSVFVGIVHSVLGEVLIFKRLRVQGIVPSMAAPPLEPRNVRIIWATWHLASVFGLAFAALLFAAATGRIVLESIASCVVIGAFVSGAALVLLATKGRHPGWIGLLAVAILVYLGRSA